MSFFQRCETHGCLTNHNDETKAIIRFLKERKVPCHTQSLTSNYYNRNNRRPYATRSIECTTMTQYKGASTRRKQFQWILDSYWKFHFSKLQRQHSCETNSTLASIHVAKLHRGPINNTTKSYSRRKKKSGFMVNPSNRALSLASFYTEKKVRPGG